MSTNQKIILLILLIGAVAVIGIYEIQPATTPTNQKNVNKISGSDDATPDDSTVEDSSDTGEDLFDDTTLGGSDSGSDTGSDSGSNSGSDSGTVSGSDSVSVSGSDSNDSSTGSSDFEVNLNDDEIASAEHSSGQDDSGVSDDQSARIPPSGDQGGADSGGEDTGSSSATSDDTSDQSESSGTDSDTLLSQDDTGTSSSDASASAGAERTYEVKAGDRLWSIAKQFYGSGKDWKIIKRANEDKIPDSNRLKRGMTLTIPEQNQENTSENSVLSDQSSTSAQDQSGTDTGTSETSDETYEVKQGDRLWDIVKRKYGSATYDRVQKVAEINDLEPRNLRAGQRITLPNNLFEGSSSERASGTQDATGSSGSSAGNPPFEAGSEKEWYQVKQGESLWKISEKKFGTGKHIWKIWELNKDRFDDYNSIPANSWVLLPKNP